MGHTLRVGDTVQVITGKDRGKQGKVIAVDADRDRVRVDKVQMQKLHLKPGRKAARGGGILEREGFIHRSNVMLVDPGTGKPSRVRNQREDGRRVRVFATSGAQVPEPARK
jgi:large subunit ribosomal protein L24